MMQIRKAEDRFHTKIDWLDSKHTFSFGHHYHPHFTGFGDLLVINDDRITGGSGFPTHPHKDMEIISYVIEGGLEHKDTTGTNSVIRPGEVQRMTAGTGIRHSEYNAEKKKSTRFLQIWVLPDEAGLKPGYEQKAFADKERKNNLRLVADRNGSKGAIVVHQDMKLYSSLLEKGAKVTYEPPQGRKTWIQVAEGAINVNGSELKEGDGAAVVNTDSLELTGVKNANVLVFDLA